MDVVRLIFVAITFNKHILWAFLYVSVTIRPQWYCDGLSISPDAKCHLKNHSLFLWSLLQTLKGATTTMAAAAILAWFLRGAISVNAPGAWCSLRITTPAKVVPARAWPLLWFILLPPTPNSLPFSSGSVKILSFENSRSFWGVHPGLFILEPSKEKIPEKSTKKLTLLFCFENCD